ncbi:MAG: glutamate--tRNA ligase [Candidatus Omnitrophica bacterium]|nr:glutamate--tRNA ligase [Candidatus Omnitrophota bacterium]
MNIVRFAPSPTGFLHIGGARTGLFNWLFSRATKGKFILRIEDTDQVRSEKRFLDEILNSLQWLGMDWDELHYQSSRFDIYREYAQKLLNEGKAYKEGDAIIYKIPAEHTVKIYDLIHGEITIDAEHIKDQVLIKSDGSPAYNFCCVIDDALMAITHVIRGDDHIPNTPKQIILYEALGFKLPKFAHIPMILGEDRSRLSKRHGATSISEYRGQGILPEALINYLALLGWSPGNDREIFNLQTLIKDFSLKRVNKTAAIFDLEKLKWINSQYVKNYDLEKLTDLIIQMLKDKGYPAQDYARQWLSGLIKLYRTRFQTLEHFEQLAGFFFTDTVRYDKEAAEKFLLADNVAEYLVKFKEVLENTEPFDDKSIEAGTRKLVEEAGIEAGELIHPIRVALTGGTVSPGIFEVIQFLGKEKSITRLERVIKKLKTRGRMFDKLEEL